jgi:gamma-glutamylcyclotransferase (GGCT)/AIG2-like uncharacterized protein YtfP
MHAAVERLLLRSAQACSSRRTIQSIRASEAARAISRAMVIAAQRCRIRDHGRMPIAVFVYGTLMCGQANHHWLAGANFGGKRRLDGARLYNLGPFPMAVLADGGELDPQADAVCGELWWMDADRLEQLDRLEGHPRLYERRQLPLDDGQPAWVYLGRPHQVRHSPLLADGRWRGSAAAQG